MVYAPVIIPTLSRYEHLKQCVDSLNNCHNADKTEVYISVDYPPADKYKKGHDQICDYLDNTSFRFKKIHIFKQTTNLGVINNGSKKTSNGSFLVRLVEKLYDRWIFTEDDNVFSPGFLDFMNESLERFKDDKTVYSICGYRFYYNFKLGDNNYFRQRGDFNAWGCGFWREKKEDVKRLEVCYLRRMVYNPFKLLKLWSVSNLQVAHLATFSQKRNFKKGDNFLTLYMIDRNMTQIMPAKSMVRNIGWDETGLHCFGMPQDIIYKHINQEIDDSLSFEGLRGTGWEFFKENEKAIRDEDFQRCTFAHALYVYIKRLICFWK